MRISTEYSVTAQRYWSSSFSIRSICAASVSYSCCFNNAPYQWMAAMSTRLHLSLESSLPRLYPIFSQTHETVSRSLKDLRECLFQHLEICIALDHCLHFKVLWKEGIARVEWGMEHLLGMEVILNLFLVDGCVAVNIVRFPELRLDLFFLLFHLFVYISSTLFSRICSVSFYSLFLAS